MAPTALRGGRHCWWIPAPCGFWKMPGNMRLRSPSVRAAAPRWAITRVCARWPSSAQRIGISAEAAFARMRAGPTFHILANVISFSFIQFRCIQEVSAGLNESNFSLISINQLFSLPVLLEIVQFDPRIKNDSNQIDF